MSKTNAPADRAFDLGNNEAATVGVIPQADGTFIALTFTASKSFKTAKGAAAWLARRASK